MKIELYTKEQYKLAQMQCYKACCNYGLDHAKATPITIVLPDDEEVEIHSLDELTTDSEEAFVVIQAWQTGATWMREQILKQISK